MTISNFNGRNSTEPFETQKTKSTRRGKDCNSVTWLSLA